VIQKIVAFIAVVLEQMGADAHMIALVLFCQFTRNTPCTDSMDSKDVMHCWNSWIIMVSSTVAVSVIVTVLSLRMFMFIISCYCGQASQEFWISCASPAFCKHVYTLIHTLLRQCTVPILGT
jgi:hypothetical protein